MNVELKGLVKKFGNKVVVDNMNLTIKEGEFTVLLGPSGCGKTTTLRMIAGLEKPTSGDIFINGKRVTQLSPKDRGVAMVFQDYGLYPHMTVFENVAFPLKVAKVARTDIEIRVKDMLERLKIIDLRDRKPSEISGGEKQRVSLARALVRNPSLLLMDEPLSNLDALLRMEMRSEIKTIHQNIGTTTLYVTHDQIEALSLGTKIVVMNKGQIEQLGSPYEIYYDPATKFVAHFIGSPPMNFIKVECQYIDNELFFLAESVLLKVNEEILKSIIIYQNPELIIGIRPEHLLISNTDNNEGIRGKIVIIEPLGKENYLHIMVGTNHLLVRTEPETVFSIGDIVTLLPIPQYLYIFEVISGKRIK